MQEIITLNELLPIDEKVKKIQTGSELLLAYELGKYAKLMLGRDLSLSGVTIAKELQSGEYFSFVVTNGLDVGFIPSRETLVDYSKNARYFFTGTVDGVAFSKITPEEVIYEFEFNTQANRPLHGENRSAAYISLFAYLVVKSKLEGVPTPKLIIDHENYNQQELEYVELFVLNRYGNRITKDFIEVKYSQAWGFQPEWEAFVFSHRQRGQMNREYTVKEKARYISKNFEVGDVVLLYTRSKGAKGKTINRLLSCFPAVIKQIDSENIRLAYYPSYDTALTRRMTLQKVEHSLEGEEMESIYTYADYDRWTACPLTCHLTEIGVGTCTFIENTFFIKPVDDDGSYQYVRSGDKISEVWMSTLDSIYAVFEDRGVEYNKEKFLQTHFYSNNRMPVYDQYREQVLN